jgi:hypothetical protein
MDAREYFQLIVQPNYYEFYADQNNIRKLWNAVVSMNTVPEFLALHQLGYPLDLSREMLDGLAQEFREGLGFTDLQYCANTLKHVRKINRGQSKATASSTSVEPIDQATWVLDGHDLVQVAYAAFAKLSNVTELK